jgi:hypothetical protein
MDCVYVRLLLQHNHYDLAVARSELEVFEQILAKTLESINEPAHSTFICEFNFKDRALKFKARHLTGWVVKDTPFEVKVA